MPSKKMGRPTDSVKSIKIQIRVDEKTLSELDECVKYFNSNRSDVIRKGIQLVMSETKK